MSQIELRGSGSPINSSQPMVLELFDSCIPPSGNCHDIYICKHETSTIQINRTLERCKHLSTLILQFSIQYGLQDVPHTNNELNGTYV